MIKSKYRLFATILLLLSNPVKSDIITPTAPLPRINLASVLSPHAPCRYHFVYNNISMSELSTTRNVPVTLTKRSFPADLIPLSSLNHTPLQLDIFQNKGWICEIVVLFVTLNSLDYTKSHQKSLGYWITSQSKYYTKLREQTDWSVYPESFYFILIPSSSKILESHKTYPLYTQPVRSEPLLPVKFAVLLF